MPEIIDQLDINQIKERVHRAINNLERQDAALFNPLGSERNIAQRFACWLENEFPDWNVDIEYDQIVDGISGYTMRKTAYLLMQRVDAGYLDLDEPKEVVVIPDIIIHRRHTEDNLLAIEVKRESRQRDKQFDLEKLRGYRESKQLRYRFSLFIRFQASHGENHIVAEYQLD